MKCADCKMEYPSEILSPLESNAEKRRMLCGICALEAINNIHGIKRPRFARGSTAESYRLRAIQIRRRNARGITGS